MAFNMNKAEFMGHKVLLDSFGTLDWDRLDDLFEETFLPVIFREQGIGGITAKRNIIYTFSKTFKRSTAQIRHTPMPVSLIQEDIFHKRNYDIRECQSLGLVDCHDAHRFTRRW